MYVRTHERATQGDGDETASAADTDALAARVDALTMEDDLLVYVCASVCLCGCGV